MHASVRAGQDPLRIQLAALPSQKKAFLIKLQLFRRAALYEIMIQLIGRLRTTASNRSKWRLIGALRRAGSRGDLNKALLSTCLAAESLITPKMGDGSATNCAPHRQPIFGCAAVQLKLVYQQDENGNREQLLVMGMHGIRAGLRWYLINSLANREELASFQLKRQDFIVFLPRILKSTRHARQMRTRLAALIHERSDFGSGLSAA